MSNERLRDALLTKGIDPAALAHDLGVDRKTAERWITQGRTPYPKHRHAIAARVRETERYLWPEAVSDGKAAKVSQSEIVKVYPNRNAVPHDLWDQLLERATTYVDVLVYVGMFMTERPQLLNMLRDKAEHGARIRLIFGDRDSPAVKQRSIDEGIGQYTLSAKIDQALANFAPLVDSKGVEMRTHGTVLYNSIYRFDDDMIVNSHIYGKPAPHAPALHLRRLSAGDLFTSYADSFTAVWETATRLG